jgi:excisionase family DNA binding protein
MSTPSKVSEPPVHRASIAAVADALGCSTRTVRRYISDGRLTGYRMGPRLIRVDMAEVDALLSPIPTAGAVAQ